MLVSVIAVVDIGSNSVKVLVAKMQHGVIEEIYVDAETTSLARGLAQTGKLCDESMAATLAALRRFQKKIADLQVSETKIVATAAMREASNASLLADKISELFGVPVEIISGLTEAHLAMSGAMTARPDNTPEKDCLFADLGGASTELGFSLPQPCVVSTSLGALKTHNVLLLGGEAISDGDWKNAQAHVWSILESEISDEIKIAGKAKKTFIAVGGTIVMATKALGLSPFKPLCYPFKRRDLEDFANRLRKIDEVERAQIQNLKRDRADILPFGIMLLTQIMKYLGQENGISTVRGLRHGFVQRVLEKK